MKIPKQIKIGGKVYKVEITEKLELGRGYDAECVYSDLVIRVRPTMAKGKMECDFLHEMFHAIHDFFGYNKHDEKKIDELANALYMVIQDNPEIFEKDLVDSDYLLRNDKTDISA